MAGNLFVVTREDTVTLWDREDLAISHHTVVIGSNLDSIFRELTPAQWEDVKSRLDLSEIKVEDMRKKVFFDLADVGCHLDGCQGWHNNYRVVELAGRHGFTLSAEDASTLWRYKVFYGTVSAEFVEYVEGQGGLVDRATDYLQEHTAEGLEWTWDAGELTLLPLCQTEGFEPDHEECTHCGGEQ